MVRAGRYPGLAFECGIRKNGLGKARPDYSLYGENNGSGHAVFGRLCGTLILKIDLIIICTCSDDCRLVHTLNGSYTDRRGNACPYCSGKRCSYRSLGRSRSFPDLIIDILPVIDA